MAGELSSETVWRLRESRVRTEEWRSWRFAIPFSGVTQTVNDRKQHSGKPSVNQGGGAVVPEPCKIGASTPFDFDSKNLTAYGGLLPIATMLERLWFPQLLEETLTPKQATPRMSLFHFLLPHAFA